MTNIGFPYRFEQGRTATVDDAQHIRDMIEQFLFTNPGERVNRPNFGSGLLNLLFEPLSTELLSLLQNTVQAGLQQWLSDLILVNLVEVTSADSAVHIVVQYTVLRTAEVRTETFERGSV